MADLISIGASGVKAYTAALATIGDNIANSQTPGFVRRAIRTSETPSGGDVVLLKSQIRPGGALATGVTRAIDTWLVEDARVAEGETGRTSTRLKWLESAERAINDTATGVGATVTSIFNAADRLASNPSDTSLRAAFLQSADDAAAAFRRTAEGLERTAAGVQTDAQGTATQLNSDLTALERVNAGLRRARDASTNQATLMDERDRLLDSISGAIGITTEVDERGVATVRLSPPSNEPLVAAGGVNAISIAVQADGTLSFSTISGNSLTPISGKLAGLADASTDIAGRRQNLDALATQFAAEFNSAHQAGTDALGNPGAALFVIGSAGAASIVAAALDPAQVAAASGSGANGNLLAMSNLRGPSGSEAAWAALASAQTQATAGARAQDAAASARREGAQSARADISAVDLDHEAAELLRFQQAYQGSARVLQVARETMQSILNAF